MWRIGMLGFLAMAACYRPNFADCEVACESGNGCPSGLTCDPAVGRCRVAGAGVSCGSLTADAREDGGDGDGDAMIDAEIVDAPTDGPPDAPPDASCMFSTPVTNFDPCVGGFPPAGPARVFNTSGTLDTDAGTFNGQAIGASYTYMGSTMRLVHVESLAVNTGVTVSVVGATPLLFVSQSTANIEGTIDLTGSSALTANCGGGTGIGANNIATGAGGGGGGHGTAGGTGGDTPASTTPGNGGPPAGGANLAPLSPGCRGGDGAEATGPGGPGGLGGGALEISARSSLAVSGDILSGGQGGTKGGISTTGCADCSSGGGGGGAGGGILLEAPMIELENTARICATGGGGGAGGGGVTTDGSDGVCTGGLGGNGIGGPMTGRGGNGAAATGTGAGGNSGMTNSPRVGGGGGGGGTGRIRMHGTVSMTGTPTVVPAATP